MAFYSIKGIKCLFVCFLNSLSFSTASILLASGSSALRYHTIPYMLYFRVPMKPVTLIGFFFFLDFSLDCYSFSVASQGNRAILRVVKQGG